MHTFAADCARKQFSSARSSPDPACSRALLSDRNTWLMFWGSSRDTQQIPIFVSLHNHMEQPHPSIPASNWRRPVLSSAKKTRRQHHLVLLLGNQRRWGGGSGWGASWVFGGARSVGLGTRWQGAGISTCHRCSATCSGQSWDRCPRCHKAQQWREAAALPALVEQRLLHFPATARASAAPATVASSRSGGTSWHGVGAVPCKGELMESCLCCLHPKNTAEVVLLGNQARPEAEVRWG